MLSHPQELEALKTELEDSLDTTAAVQDLRNKRESELQELKRTLETSQQQHELQLQDLRTRYSQQIEALTDEVENVRKVLHSPTPVQLGVGSFCFSFGFYFHLLVFILFILELNLGEKHFAFCVEKSDFFPLSLL